MTLTVRLAPDLDAALQRYSLEQGVTKSLVVQQALAAYLPTTGEAATSAVRVGAAVSQNYRAFAEAGLIGAGNLGGRSADKAAVRERVIRRVRRSQTGSK